MALLAASAPGGSREYARWRYHRRSGQGEHYGVAPSGGGYTFLIFNNTLGAIGVIARVRGAASASFSATLTTYGKAQYDVSRNNRWIGPVSQSLGQVSATGIPLTLPPYSLSVLALK